MARILAVLFALPVWWTFAYEGVTTTTESNYLTGETSSSSDLGSQLSSSIIWIILAAAAGVAAWYFKKNQVEWPEVAEEHLRQLKLAPPA